MSESDQAGPDKIIDTNQQDNYIGLIPAAGHASRMGKLPCSKEILPPGSNSGGTGVTVLTDLLLAQFQACGVSAAAMAIAPHKTDIINYYGDCSPQGISMHYTTLQSASAVHSIDACLATTRHRTVLFGLPDILLPVNNAFTPLLTTLQQQQADVVLGLFTTQQPHSADMVHCSPSGQVLDILIKQDQYPSAFTHTWACAVWQPQFSEFLHTFVERQQPAARELYVGDVFLAAMQAGLRIHAQVLAEHACLDAGTPQSYQQALNLYRQSQHNIKDNTDNNAEQNKSTAI